MNFKEFAEEVESLPDEIREVLPFNLKLRELGLTDKQIVDILLAISEICHHCWIGDADCRCWDDS